MKTENNFLAFDLFKTLGFNLAELPNALNPKLSLPGESGGIKVTIETSGFDDPKISHEIDLSFTDESSATFSFDEDDNPLHVLIWNQEGECVISEKYSAAKKDAYPLQKWIDEHFTGVQLRFAEREDVKPQQITQWIGKGYIVADGVMYSPRRELKS